MAIVPTVRCSNMRRSLAFYVELLGFERVDENGAPDDPIFTVLLRGRDRLFLSSHAGDGDFRELRRRGLRMPGRPESPVHEAPLDQTWGTRDFYVDDPDGNTLRFTQLL